MNRAAEVLGCLSEENAPSALIIAPSAPPVSRGAHTLDVILNTIFSGDDVNDTLLALMNMAQAPSSVTVGTLVITPATAQNLKPTTDQRLLASRLGAFSFGIRDVGRFKVTYATQRGSRIVYITRVPVIIPPLDQLLDETSDAERAIDILRAGHPGVLPVVGPSEEDNNTAVYSLLKELNKTERKLMYILERTITFLMRHDNAIVLQSELNTDVESLEEGVQDAFMLRPDIMYIGSVRPSDALPTLVPLAEGGALVILTSSTVSGPVLLEQYQPRFKEARSVRPWTGDQVIEVLPGGEGKLSLKLSPAA